MHLRVLWLMPPVMVFDHPDLCPSDQGAEGNLRFRWKHPLGKIFILFPLTQCYYLSDDNGIVSYDFYLKYV